MPDRLERMKSIVAQALAEARRAGSNSRLARIHLELYSGMDEAGAISLFTEASRGTEAEGVPLALHIAGSRYICWNCCGLRFASADGVCPNCGEDALEVPEEIGFSLQHIEVSANRNAPPK